MALLSPCPVGFSRPPDIDSCSCSRELTPLAGYLARTLDNTFFTRSARQQSGYLATRFLSAPSHTFPSRGTLTLRGRSSGTAIRETEF